MSGGPASPGAGRRGGPKGGGPTGGGPKGGPKRGGPKRPGTGSRPPHAARAKAPELPFAAVLQKRGRFLLAQPLFERGRPVTLDGRGRTQAAAGDLVLIGPGKRGPRIARPIGRPERARDVLEALMLDRGLYRAFPRAAAADAGEVSTAPPQRGRERLDLTELPTFTVDPATARDYDDAISARAEEDGGVRLWVHIADVSAYVRPGRPIEREAFRRATSVYVPGAVEPMLPDALSSGACSLVPGEERLAVSVELELSADAEVRSARFHRSRIRSDARLDYDAVDRIFAGQEHAAAPWDGALAAARTVASALTERRADRGALAVESSERAFALDAKGDVAGVASEAQTESHRLIEELMILANEVVAGHLVDRRQPTLYRVHERPDPQAVEALVERLASLEVPTPPLPRHMSPQQAGELIGEVSRLVAAHVKRTGHGRAALTSQLLRSLKQAYYSPENIGHAGLASPRYCHFTSPIRRYPDVVAHRALLATVGLDDVAPRAEDLEEAGVESSASERAALRIERDAADVCACFLLERVLAEHGSNGAFEGEVVGVIGAGAFVRFGAGGFEGFEGMLPVRRMPDDWWNLNEEGTALVGESSGRMLKLGDPIDVQVQGIDRPRGRVDLVRPARNGSR